MSNNASVKAKGQLIVPSTYRPWSVDVCAAVPRSLRNLNSEGEPPKKKKKRSTVLDSQTFNAGAVCPGWACLSTTAGSVYVWPTNKENNNSSGGSLTASPAAKKAVADPLEAAIALYHPNTLPPANLDPSIRTKPLIGLARVHPGSNEAIFVYVCQPSTGALLAWKVTQGDAKKAGAGLKTPSHYASTFLPLERKEEDDDEQDNNHQNYPDELVVSLAVVDRQMLVFGTSSGALIFCSVSTIPVALHAQRLIPAKSRKSFGFFWSSSAADDEVIRDGYPIKFALPLTALNGDDNNDDTTTLLAISQLGTIWHWKIIPTVAQNHSVTSKVRFSASILALFQENLSPSIENLSYVEPLQAKLLDNRMHVIVRTTQANEGECRLYWLRLRIERDGSKINLAWVDAQWLNRFPAPQDIQAMGLVLSADNLAYAAFHQRSGGVTSSVIVMALSDSEQGDGGEASSTVYEVDLPMTEVPALLPDTFTNDIETHGCCVFARSGLGIRVRMLTAEAPASLSPRAAARANPTSVLKLSSHVQSAFLEAYQHQDGTAGSLALPPSLVQANPVDLEEAVIAVATELHVRRNSDSSGWASVALLSNGLEWHLALIQWLRQGGLYRSLTSFAKWRLLSLGQEVVAFQELVTPTMSPKATNWEKEQFSDLTLSQGIAVWLKEKLDFVLRDGSIDQYQLWCGWFSTALASATTYREERATATYDITMIDQPPMIGSMDEEGASKPTRVPWTSHPVLQDCFAMLLHHWLHHPKQKGVQVLPHQTLAVIAKAALDSFADSAKSLNTERAIGKYAEIKAMTIPLLLSNSRTAERGDDKLAFKLAVKHDYYEGICQIAHDHANKPDSDSFRLEPLLQSTTQCQSRDFQSGFNFGQFVLHYYAERGLYGHTILYGRLCPERDLNHVMQSDERLRSHQWIQAIHKGNYDLAATSLISRAENRPLDLTQSRWSYCMAKLSNQVMLKEAHLDQARAEARAKKIEAKLELAGIQKELLAQSEQHLWSPKNLLSLALEKAEEASDGKSNSAIEDATRYCYLALLVCTTFETEADQRSNAVQVWSKSISVDWARWSEWIRTEHDLSRDALAYTVLDNTTFGGLLKECGDEFRLGPVTFTSETMEQQIIEQLGLEGGSGVDSLRRFLFNVTKVFQAGAMEEDDEAMFDASG
ncbi:expressed unknown protein [Seminavis robusta]|uniref:Uncharacterized protein n=1 Tax=Seminavis robusta TaxID=568900 RepID=A0A9N8H796_9STRA|nr:expressed unknown protein [Seminavis robusta]|eukprot:Sro63_g035960.1 n/a (1164) ;mRNA; r:97494-101154